MVCCRRQAFEEEKKILKQKRLSRPSLSTWLGAPFTVVTLRPWTNVHGLMHMHVCTHTFFFYFLLSPCADFPSDWQCGWFLLSGRLKWALSHHGRLLRFPTTIPLSPPTQPFTSFVSCPLKPTSSSSRTSSSALAPLWISTALFIFFFSIIISGCS